MAGFCFFCDGRFPFWTHIHVFSDQRRCGLRSVVRVLQAVSRFLAACCPLSKSDAAADLRFSGDEAAAVRHAKELVRPGTAQPWATVTADACAKFLPPDPTAWDGGVERREAAGLSPAEFVQRYETGEGRPAVLLGLAEGWAAAAWTLDTLVRRFRRRDVVVGDDDKGYAVELPLSTFAAYCRANRDRNPLYMFDDTFFDDPAPRRAFAVPRLFREDLFRHLPGGEAGRFAYRWLLAGPARSGTAPHVDPLGTSAWNTCLSGSKWWVLLRPEVPAEVALMGVDEEAPDLFGWYRDTLPRVVAAAGPGACVQFLQGPGETVFVPGGWWHAVLNVEESLAITQNFVSSTNAVRVWRALSSEHPDMAEGWLRNLRREEPRVAALLERCRSGER